MPSTIDSVLYLDHNATTPIDPKVAEAMAECLATLPANPGSQHSLGRKARRRLDDARDAIVQALGGEEADSLILTSGGTESNNLALRGLIGEPPGKIALSSVEHPSVSNMARRLEEKGWTVASIQNDHRGVIDLDHVHRSLLDGCDLVSVIYANSETGVLQPIGDVAALCQEHHVPLHSDAAQAVGKINLNFRDLGATAITLAAHKFHGPVGIGGLLVRQDQPLRPLLRGGPQQFELRPGTESVALAVGLQTALTQGEAEADERYSRMTHLRDRFERLLCEELPDLTIHGIDAPRLPNTSNIAFGGLDRQALFMRLDRAGVCCSTGTACSSGSSEPSPVLLAMGLPQAVVESSLRFSLGSTTRQPEIDQAVDRIIETVKELRRGSEGRKGPPPPRTKGSRQV